MKDFKTKQQMTAGHYCWGGKAMKKAEGGSVRSQFDAAFGEARKRGDKTFEFKGKQYGTQLAKPKPKEKVEVGPHGPGSEEFTPDVKPTPAPGQKSGYKIPDVGLRVGKSGEPAIKFGSGAEEPDTRKQQMDEVKARFAKSDAEQLDRDRERLLSRAKGGRASAPKLASDKKKYSDRDMQGIISQAKQMAPKIIQANQARAAQAQAAAGAQRPPLGGAMPARPPMGAAPAGAMPAMKKGGANWIKGAIKKPGALHKALHVPKGEKIPDEKLEKASHSDNPTMAKRARLAKTLKSFRKG